MNLGAAVCMSSTVVLTEESIEMILGGCRTIVNHVPFDAHSLAVVTGAVHSLAAYFQLKVSNDPDLHPTDVSPCPFCGLVASEATT